MKDSLSAPNVLYLGQIGFDPKTMKCVEGGVEAETHQVLKNMGAILKNAGLDFSNGSTTPIGPLLK